MTQKMKGSPLISVIVPVYNGQAYIEKCIGTIEGQTYPNLEIIIVNDGSKDGTGEVCERLALAYGNIRVLTLEDQGVSAARNAGLDEAKGAFVTFVDADDRLLPDMLTVLYDCIRDAGSSVAGCAFFSWKEEAEFEEAAARMQEAGRKEPWAGQKRIFTAEEFLEEGILGGNSRCWSKLYARSVIGNQRFRQGLTIGEDMLFLVDLIPCIGQIAECDYPGYGYFQNPGGAMNREFQPRYMDQIACWEIARERIGEISFRKCHGKRTEYEQERSGRVYTQATAILMMSVMLTAGKLALLSGKERKRQGEYIRVCRDKIRKELHTPGAYERLSVGYKVKTKLFAAAPGVYLWLYHLMKLRKP